MLNWQYQGNFDHRPLQKDFVGFITSLNPRASENTLVLLICENGSQPRVVLAPGEHPQHLEIFCLPHQWVEAGEAAGHPIRAGIPPPQRTIWTKRSIVLGWRNLPGIHPPLGKFISEVPML